MKLHRVNVVLALLIAVSIVVIGMSLDNHSVTPTPTPTTPLLTPANTAPHTCALVVYDDATAYTIEGEPTFNLAQGTHTEATGLTVDLAFYRINENNRIAYLHVTTAVPVDAACLDHLPLLTDLLPRMFDTP